MTKPTPKKRKRGTDEKLRVLITDYENRMDEIAELVARVRHEINNPLTGLLLMRRRANASRQ